MRMGWSWLRPLDTIVRHLQLHCLRQSLTLLYFSISLNLRTGVQLQR